MVQNTHWTRSVDGTEDPRHQVAAARIRFEAGDVSGGVSGAGTSGGGEGVESTRNAGVTLDIPSVDCRVVNHHNGGVSGLEPESSRQHSRGEMLRQGDSVLCFLSHLVCRPRAMPAGAIENSIAGR